MLSLSPRQTLDVQVDLVHWLNTDRGMSYVEGFVASLERSQAARGGTLQPEITPERILAEFTYDLDRAATYWVAPQMVSLAEHAAKTMSTQPLRATDLPSTRGFLWLDKILYIVDVNGQRCGVRAISWGTTNIAVSASDAPAGSDRGVLVVLWTDREDPEDEVLRTMRDEHGPAYLRRLNRLVLFHYSPWPYGFTYVRNENAPLGGDTLSLRFVAALWALIQQKTLAPRLVVRPDRAQLKRIQRGGLLIEQPDVQIILLRKIEHHESDGSGANAADWSHQWLVSGHWRNQYYPSIGEHRQRWINPYVKGPADAPFILKDRVYKLSR